MNNKNAEVKSWQRADTQAAKWFIRFSAALMLVANISFAQTTQPISDWPPITQQTKPWTRWWWPGSAVDEKNLTRELEQFRDVGIGGVEITPIYGVHGFDNREIQFLSPQWIKMLSHVSQEAARLNLGVDMATGTGWPFGGPMIDENFSDQSVKIVDGKIVAKPTRMKVKRAAPGDAGLVVNPYSTAAIAHYLQAFDAIPDGIVRAQFHDSFEYSGNWCSELFARFKKDHGYDLNDHAAEFGGQGDADTVARVKSDYRETLSNLHLDYVKAWVDWSHAHHFLAREQAHGSPANLLDVYAAADIPETESFGASHFDIPGLRYEANDVADDHHPDFLLSKFASSAAHVSGKNLASCETLTWLREHFRASLAMAKPQIDEMFLAGINHIFYHGSCYSPDDAPYPGWEFYAATEINSRSTLWHDLPAMNDYVARCQAVLQAGYPANDVLVYWPIYDAWNSKDGLEKRFAVEHVDQWLEGTEFAKTCDALTAAGCAFDLISDAQIGLCSFDGGQIVTAGGGKYRTLIVPPIMTIPPETLQAIFSLASGGAKIVFMEAMPREVPGFSEVKIREQMLRGSVDSLHFSDDANGVKIASLATGKVILSTDVSQALAATNVKGEALAATGLQFIKRRIGNNTYYFIANLTGRLIETQVALNASATSVELLNPLTGRIRLGSIDLQGAVLLQLDPGESIFARCRSDISEAPSQRHIIQNLSESPIDLKGAWHVEFLQGGPELPAAFDEPALTSWTEQADPRTKDFAGSARYRTEFDAPKINAKSWRLDLGDVRESARVKLNGKEVGTAWSLPMRVELGELQPHNVLEIEVTNLPANRIAAMDRAGVKWKIFKDANFVNLRYKPFDASTWKPMPAGLLGPVTLVAGE